MSLTAAFNIARTALNASSLGIQVTGNNLANVATHTRLYPPTHPTHAPTHTRPHAPTHTHHNAILTHPARPGEASTCRHRTGPRSIAATRSYLAVADTNNNRILLWKGDPDALTNIAAKAGYDVSPVRPLMDMLKAQA